MANEYTSLGGDPIRLRRLRRVVTPNETAEFFYSLDRKDEIWMNAAGTAAIATMPVLDSVRIYNMEGKTRRKISFHQDYYLRPGTNSALFCEAPLPGNPNAASLTLRKVVLSDADNQDLPAIVMTYDETMNFSAGEIRRNRLFTQNPTPGCYVLGDVLIQPKDVWGYYCPIPDGSNDFNPTGLRTRTCIGNTNVPYAAAWSLKGIGFPSGQKVEWEYETPMYDRCNGIPVSSGNGAPRYGGGVRVRKVSLHDGINVENSGVQTWTYFYTSNNGVFEGRIPILWPLFVNI